MQRNLFESDDVSLRDLSNSRGASDKNTPQRRRYYTAYRIVKRKICTVACFIADARLSFSCGFLLDSRIRANEDGVTFFLFPALKMRSFNQDINFRCEGPRVTPRTLTPARTLCRRSSQNKCIINTRNFNYCITSN